jgi:hypothetical protein
LVYPPEIGNVPFAAFLADCKYILVPHGRKLEYPVFPSATWESRVPVDLGPLLSLCPAVTHLILSSFAAFHPACTFLLVKWLDSWAEFIHGELPMAPALPAVFPSLEGVRLIDKTLDGAEHGAARTGERRPRRRGPQVVASLAAADRGPRCARLCRAAHEGALDER